MTTEPISYSLISVTHCGNQS